MSPSNRMITKLWHVARPLRESTYSIMEDDDTIATMLTEKAAVDIAMHHNAQVMALADRIHNLEEDERVRAFVAEHRLPQIEFDPVDLRGLPKIKKAKKKKGKKK